MRGHPRAARRGEQVLQAISARARHAPRAVAIAEIDIRGECRRAITSEDFAHHCRARALALAESCRPGETVLIALPSGIDLAIWFISAIAAGLRLVLLHPACGPGELKSAADRSNAITVMHQGDLSLAASCTACPVASLAATDRLTGDLLVPGRSPGALVLASSGTTGLPKLAVRQAPALDADALAITTGLSLTPKDVLLCIPPLCHSYGADILLGALYSGAALHIMPQFDAAALAAQLAATNSSITVLPGIPFIYEALLKTSWNGEGRLRLALSAGWSLSDRIRRSCANRWGLQIGQLFGATELGTVAVSRPDHPRFDPHAIGPPLPGVSFRILTTEPPYADLPDGAVGQLAVQAPSMLSGYLDGDLLLVDGHLLTGDLARREPGGQVTITGRLKHLIEVGGGKVNPLEVEAALREHPAIADCAVTALHLSDTIARVRALFIPASAESPPTPRELRAFLKQRLAPHKIPRTFDAVAALPRSPLGKLLRDQLPGPPC
jgi:acyl-CoA synthetase (AMP-forming)/AMP-acid ligase II